MGKRGQMGARELLSKLIVEANNTEVPIETRKILKYAVEFIQGEIASPMRPRMRLVPFGEFYEVICPSCGEPLETESRCCCNCKQQIDWTKL